MPGRSSRWLSRGPRGGLRCQRLTGLRTLLALTILLFHFTPAGLTWERHPWVTLYPIINIGYVFVSFFFLISGFILSYNYAGRPEPMHARDFWMARLSRLYPVYALTMLISIPMLMTEWAVRPRVDFWEGAIATPFLLQGFFPHLATFWNTVSWTLSCEVVLYVAFPWLLRLRWPKSAGKLIAMVAGLWVLGMVPHALYMLTNPDHFAKAADRYSDGTWINVLKYTPAAYLCTFLAGLTLGRLHEALRLDSRERATLGLAGFAGVWFVCYHFAERLPYVLVHGGLLTPLFAAIILGLAGTEPAGQRFFVEAAGSSGGFDVCALPVALQCVCAAAEPPGLAEVGTGAVRSMDKLPLRDPAGAGGKEVG